LRDFVGGDARALLWRFFFAPADVFFFCARAFLGARFFAPRRATTRAFVRVDLPFARFAMPGEA
jgi:hypothetical protein